MARKKKSRLPASSPVIKPEGTPQGTLEGTRARAHHFRNRISKDHLCMIPTAKCYLGVSAVSSKMQ
ncbi:hypothetical protein BTUL_0086g00320 [Botrytis tulipae]|uniref:Uncharacterized protein n=1 Tax=Botrytis tulipae TaxID=87230 RepID=A0A4Z1EUL1_9HELO|nr:hypothetical protein BTUL_0086g00320 [Botrytis tulipae]